MNDRYLLDTNAVTAALKLDDLLIPHLVQATEIVIPSIVIGELYYGAYKSSRVGANLVIFDAIVRHNTILDCNAHTGQIYGSIKANLEARGQRIPENDMWIAALAIQHSLTLLTRDAHFDRVTDLLRERW